MTETGAICLTPADSPAEKQHSAGVLLPGCEAKVKQFNPYSAKTLCINYGDQRGFFNLKSSDNILVYYFRVI